MAEFTGQNILVLGGSRGIGAAIVRRFAEGGGQVAFTYAGSKAAADAVAAETGAEAIRPTALIATRCSRLWPGAAHSTCSLSTPARSF